MIPHQKTKPPDDLEGLPVVVGVTEHRLQVLSLGCDRWRRGWGAEAGLVLGRSVERILRSRLFSASSSLSLALIGLGAPASSRIASTRRLICRSMRSMSPDFMPAFAADAAVTLLVHLRHELPRKLFEQRGLHQVGLEAMQDRVLHVVAAQRSGGWRRLPDRVRRHRRSDWRRIWCSSPRRPRISSGRREDSAGAGASRSPPFCDPAGSHGPIRSRSVFDGIPELLRNDAQLQHVL